METPRAGTKTRTPEPQGDVAAHPTAPSAPTGPGFAVPPAPLGIDRQFTLQHLHPDSPAARLDWPRDHAARSDSADTFGAPPGLEDDEDLDVDRDSSVRSRAAQAWQYIRDRLTIENIYTLEAMIEDPDLAMTLAQQELVKKIGRYGSVGDKSGIRRSVLDLVEKLDVSSPLDGAVLLVDPNQAQPLSPGLTQQLTSLPSGKQSLQMTQGGKVLGQLAPILAQNGTFGGKDGMDRGWSRLTERFTQQARGQIDLIVPSVAPGPPVAGQSRGPIGTWQAGGMSSGPSDAPVGQWVQPGQAGNAQPTGASDQAIGQWRVPSAQGDPANAPLGQWIQPDQVGNAQPAGASDQGIGQWRVPGTPSDPSNAPVGQWVQPGQAGNAQLAGGGDQGIGQWKVPGTASDPSNAPVGQWIQPNDAGNAQLAAGGDRDIGQWKVPGTASDPASAPVGEWIQPKDAGNAQLAEGGDRDLGRWKVPGTSSDPASAPVGQWVQPDAGDGTRLSAGGDQGVGKWAVPGSAQGPAGDPVGAWTTPERAAPRPPVSGGVGGWNIPGAPGSPLPPQIGQWLTAKDLPIADGLSLSDVIRQNPNISGVRLVELLPGQNPQQPSRLGTLASAARSLLASRFGLR